MGGPGPPGALSVFWRAPPSAPLRHGWGNQDQYECWDYKLLHSCEDDEYFFGFVLQGPARPLPLFVALKTLHTLNGLTLRKLCDAMDVPDLRSVFL